MEPSKAIQFICAGCGKILTTDRESTGDPIEDFYSTLPEGWGRVIRKYGTIVSNLCPNPECEKKILKRDSCDL